MPGLWRVVADYTQRDLGRSRPLAGSDPSIMQTTAVPDGNRLVLRGQKALITGAEGASVGILMPKSAVRAPMFVADLPDPAIRIERVLNTIDSSMPSGHATVAITYLRVLADQMLGQSGNGFKLAQIRLSPARLSHCMRWHGAAVRANEIAIDYARRRHAFGKSPVDHEGVGFKFAYSLIGQKQAELMIDWCAAALDTGSLGTVDPSMTKVARGPVLRRRSLRPGGGRIRYHPRHHGRTGLPRNPGVPHL